MCGSSKADILEVERVYWLVVFLIMMLPSVIILGAMIFEFSRRVRD